MAWDLRPVGTEFFDDAPHRWSFSRDVGASPARVFNALACDPAGWGTWYPGFSPRGFYTTAAPQRVGSVRRMWMARVRYEESILEWDEPSLWSFRVDSTSLPVAYALAERYRVSESPGGSAVQWTFAIDPRPPVRSASGAMEPVLAALFTRAMANLERRLQR
jgi:hypothetical protein